MVSKKFPGKFNCLGDICEFVTGEAKAAGLDEKEIYAVQLAVDEACTNIIEHAYGGEGKGDIELICKVLNGGMEIVLKDDGEPFDPDLITEPKIGLPLKKDNIFSKRNISPFIIKFSISNGFNLYFFDNLGINSHG